MEYEYDDLDPLPPRPPTKPLSKHEALAVISDAVADVWEGGALPHMGLAYFNLKLALAEMAEKLIPEVMEEFDKWWEDQE